MNNFKKYFTLSLFLVISLNYWACDDRVPDTASTTNATLVVSQLQAITDDGSSVGEVVSGSSNMRFVVTLKNESGQVLKDKEITFSHNGSGGSFENGTSEITDENGQVINIFKPNTAEDMVDKSTTPDYEGLIVTAKYSTSLTTKAKFNVYPNQDDVWPYSLIVTSDVESIKLDNGDTKAEIEARLFNKTNMPLTNVILSFSSNRGYIDSEGTTDSSGSVKLSFQDNGTPEDIGLANIICTFNHPGFSSSISDSAQVTIGTDNELTLQILSIAFDETQNTVVVGEDITGDISYTSLIATVRDTNNEPISGQAVVFIATSSNTEVGSITYLNQVSNTDGQVVAYFDDGGNIYKDTPGTPNYEGVTVVAQLGDKITSPEKFNVYSSDDVWPYNLFVTTNTDVIQLDGGVSTATITARLLNRLGNPVTDGQINYIASRGFISATGFTDATGVDSVSFTDLGNPEDVGVSDISATFSHPGFTDIYIQDSLQVYIEDPSFQNCAYIAIPTSSPGKIVVRDGGGIESTLIKAEVYDDNNNLINTPTPVVFTLNPLVGEAYLNEVGQTTVTAYTVNGVASVSINSGTSPGPVRIEVTCDCDQDGSVDLNSVDVPVIIASGAPYHISAEYDPTNTEAIEDGFYRTGCAALISDRWYNPVEDSTYVYWSIVPIAPDTVINASVDGVSFTFNDGVMGGEPVEGVARSSIVYATDAIGDIGRVRALTFGANGDSIYTYINDDEGDAIMFFMPGQITMIASASYWDFTFNGEPAEITITAIVNDFYGNAVVDVPISFSGTGVSAFLEVGTEAYTDEGVNGLGADDGCFTWRDYGSDDDPTTTDWGNFNDMHDAIDTTGDGVWDVSEVSEPFDDFGADGVDGTADEGEADGEWDGYSMIGCEAIVLTDKNGYAKITVQYNKELCILANEDEDTGICTWDDFTSSITATLMIPQITSSDPMDILLVRSPDTCD